MKRNRKHSRVSLYIALFVGLLFASAIRPLNNEYETYQFMHGYGRSVTKLLSSDGRASGGTGFQVRYKGQEYTVTNDHVCRLAGDKGYLLASPTFGGVQELRVLAHSEDTDLCLLAPRNDAPALTIADRNPKKGSPIAVLGHPLLLGLTRSNGKILGFEKAHILEFIIESDEDRKACVGNKRRLAPMFFGLMLGCVSEIPSLKTSAPVKPGNSGSPVFQDGKVAGVIFASDGGRISFLVPAKDLKKFIDKYEASK